MFSMFNIPSTASMFSYNYLILFMKVGFFFAKTNAESFRKFLSPTNKFEVIGLFPMDNINSNGVVWSETFRYYIEKRNKVCNVFSYRLYDLPHKKTSFVITNFTLDILLDRGVIEKPERCKCESINEHLTSVLGIVGSAASYGTAAISKLVRYESIPLVSYISTNDELSDKDIYPNVFRTIPPDSVQVKVMLSLLNLFNWTYISFIYHDTSYGRSGLDAVINKKICLANILSINSDLLNINSALIQLKQDDKANVIIIYGASFVVRAILLKAYAENFINKVWILSEALGRDQFLVELSKKFKAHIFSIIPTAGLDKEFESYFLNLSYSEVKATPWLKRIFHKSGANVSNSDVKLEKFESHFDFSFVGYVRNAILAYTEMIISLRKQRPTICKKESRIIINFTDILSLLKNTSFLGLNGEEIKFDQNGNLVNYYFNVYTIDQFDNIRKTSSETNMEFLLFANWSQSNERFLNINTKIYQKLSNIESKCSSICREGYTNVTYAGGKSCCWSCFLCPENKVKSKDGNFKCEKCPLYTIPNKNRTKCLKRFTVTITTNDPYGLIIIGSSSLGIIFTISILLLYTMKRKTPVVRSSNFSLSLMQLISHLIIFSLTCLFTGDNTITKCKIRTYGISFFYILTIALILTKVTHIVRIFKANRRLTKSDVRHHKNMDLLLILICLSIFIVITTIVHETQNHDMQENIIDTNNINYHMVSKCSSNTNFVPSVIYGLILQIVCGIQSFRGRNVPSKYNEAKYISYAMFVSTSLGLALIFLKSSITSYRNSTLLESVIIIASNFTILALLHGFKVAVMIFCKNQNTVEVFKESCWRQNSENVSQSM